MVDKVIIVSRGDQQFKLYEQNGQLCVDRATASKVASSCHHCSKLALKSLRPALQTMVPIEQLFCEHCIEDISAQASKADRSIGELFHKIVLPQEEENTEEAPSTLDLEGPSALDLDKEVEDLQEPEESSEHDFDSEPKEVCEHDVAVSKPKVMPEPSHLSEVETVSSPISSDILSKAKLVFSTFLVLLALILAAVLCPVLLVV